MGRNGPSQWSTILPTEVDVTLADVPVAGSPAMPPGTDAGDPTRIRIAVMTTSNSRSYVEFRLRLDTVEAWFHDCLSAVFDRERMRAWLRHPVGWLAEGDVVLSVDPRFGPERIAIALTDVLTWTIAVQDVSALRERV